MEPENPGLDIMKAAAEGIGRESVSKLLGGLFPFLGLKRKAVDVYVADIEKSNLAPESKMLAIASAKKTYREMKNQAAIVCNAYSAAKKGTDFSDGSTVDDDWLSRFMDAGRHVSNEDAQKLWGGILAGEFEEPGSTPPSVIRTLSELTNKDALAFATLCSMEVTLQLSGTTKWRQIIVPSEKIMPSLPRLGLNFLTLTELDSLGLIDFDVVSGFSRRLKRKQKINLRVTYGSEAITISDWEDDQIPVGTVLLTSVGKCIYRFVEKRDIPGYLDTLNAFFKSEADLNLLLQE